jgi:hypothetical protein
LYLLQAAILRIFTASANLYRLQAHSRRTYENLYLLPAALLRIFTVFNHIQGEAAGSCRCSHSAKKFLFMLFLPSPSTFKAKPLAAADAAIVQKPLWAKSVVYVIKYTRYIRQIVWPFFSTSYSTSVYRGPLPPGSVLGREESEDVGLGFWVLGLGPCVARKSKRGREVEKEDVCLQWKARSRRNRNRQSDT